jgi:hypothetical protein
VGVSSGWTVQCEKRGDEETVAIGNTVRRHADLAA